jgi:septum formation protein
VDEKPGKSESPRDYVERLAETKARAQAEPGELVLAADTVVVQNGSLMGKPASREDARRMLRVLQDQEHHVLTAVAVLDVDAGRLALRTEDTQVRIGPLSDAQIDWYVATGEPMDKAGAYAIQGLGALFVESVEGNYSNVVGLPLPLTRQLFQELGHDLMSF